MTDITLSTSVADLVAAGLIKSPEQLGALLTKKSRASSSGPEHEILCTRILETIDKGPSGAKWKTGVLNQVIFGMIKGISEESERVQHHARIGKALKSLASDGLINRPHVTNAAHSFYMKIEKAEASPVIEDPKAEEVESQVPETQVVAVIEDQPQPKARVRKKK